MDTTGQSYFADAHPYLEEPLEHLIREIPELKGLQPAEDQSELQMILRGTGQAVEAFFEHMVNVVGHEEVKQELINGKGKTTANRQRRYDYLILIHRDEKPPRVDEYRMDANGNPAKQEGLASGYSITSGFALKCIHFLPGLQWESTFRHLGDQTIEGRDSYVVAFAQLPGRASVTTVANGKWGSVILLVQGVAWVDRSTLSLWTLRVNGLRAQAEPISRITRASRQNAAKASPVGDTGVPQRARQLTVCIPIQQPKCHAQDPPSAPARPSKPSTTNSPR